MPGIGTNDSHVLKSWQGGEIYLVTRGGDSYIMDDMDVCQGHSNPYPLQTNDGKYLKIYIAGKSISTCIYLHF